MPRLTVRKEALRQKIEDAKSREYFAYEQKLEEWKTQQKENRNLVLGLLDNAKLIVKSNDFSNVSVGYNGKLTVYIGHVPEEVTTLNPPKPPNNREHDRALSLLDMAAKDEISVNTQDFARYL